MPAQATTEHEHPETVLDLPIGELILCLRGGGYDEKVLHLRSNKCTFGGRADCTVQLPDGAPLQCLILRGPGGTVVRDRSGLSRLNGRPFSDTALHVGDCLQVGPVEVKVLADRPADAAAPASATDSSERPLAPHHTANQSAADLPIRPDACPSDIHVRFDRLEGRLTRLERMIGEVLNLQHQANTHSAAADTQPHFHTFPASEPARPIEAEVKPSGAEPDAPPVPLWTQQNDDEELDPSVREYIERLLKQVSDSGEKSVPAAAAAGIAEQSSGQPDRQAVAESSPAQPAEGSPEAAVADLVEESPLVAPEPALLPPLSRPPESESKLDAMREVANLSATAAIRDFEKYQAARKTFDRLPLLLIGLACGLMLLYSAFASGKSAMFFGAGAAFVGAALTAWQLLIVARRWMAASQPVERPAH